MIPMSTVAALNYWRFLDQWHSKNAVASLPLFFSLADVDWEYCKPLLLQAPNQVALLINSLTLPSEYPKQHVLNIHMQIIVILFLLCTTTALLSVQRSPFHELMTTHYIQWQVKKVTILLRFQCNSVYLASCMQYIPQTKRIMELSPFKKVWQGAQQTCRNTLETCQVH